MLINKKLFSIIILIIPILVTVFIMLPINVIITKQIALLFLLLQYPLYFIGLISIILLCFYSILKKSFNKYLIAYILFLISSTLLIRLSPYLQLITSLPFDNIDQKVVEINEIEKGIGYFINSILYILPLVLILNLKQLNRHK